MQFRWNTWHISFLFLFCTWTCVCQAALLNYEPGITLDIPGRHEVHTGELVTLSITVMDKYASEELYAALDQGSGFCSQEISLNNEDPILGFLLRKHRTLFCKVPPGNPGVLNVVIRAHTKNWKILFESNEIPLMAVDGPPSKAISVPTSDLSLTVFGDHEVHPGDTISLAIDTADKYVASELRAQVEPSSLLCFDALGNEHPAYGFPFKGHKQLSCKLPKSVAPGRMTAHITAFTANFNGGLTSNEVSLAVLSNKRR